MYQLKSDKKKISFRKTVKAVFLLNCVFVLFCACSKNNSDNKSIFFLSNDYEKILARDTLIAVTTYNSTDYFIYRGNPMGFQLELLKDFADYLGVELRIIVENNTARSAALLLSGQCDLIAQRNMSGVCKLGLFHYSDALAFMKLVILQKQGKESFENMCIDNSDSLKVSGTVLMMSCINKALENYDCNFVFDWVDSLSSEQMIQSLSEDIVPSVVVTEDLALLFSSYYRDVKISDYIGDELPISWVVSQKSNRLLDSINAWIKSHEESGFISKKYNRYFKPNRTYRGIDYTDYLKGDNYISPFDDLIKQYSENLAWDWKLVASLIYQESRFNPDAVSWAGAYGIMQLMPKTAARFGVDSSSNVGDHINAGIKYLQYLDKNIPESVCEPEDRIKMVLASYNTGLSHILDAIALTEKYGRDPNVWKNNVEVFLVSLSEPEFYSDSVVNSGYCPGKLVKSFVNEIFERYEHYSNILN
ncbi:MAG: transglycosylase SLT domain-containing protein [Bacteroidales bacterium]|nr:transglycosylase SLT domain-containing protein [Bacteroidales bacterium]